MGVHFRPGGAFPFLGVPPNELADTHADLETLWGRSAIQLRERLCEAATPAGRFRILDEALSAHLFRPLEHHQAVPAALDAFSQMSRRPMVREMAKEVGLSQRRFIRVFATEVGITPKLFSRIQRFQRTVTLTLRTSVTPDWAQLALTCGYCDQAHLISDFLEFSGFTPTAYLRQLHYLDQHGVHRKRNHLPLPQ